jgi:peptidyl-prolyl cis-trans isomerase B (cyclophilin B)
VKQWPHPPAMSIQINKQYTANISTNLGDMQAQLFPMDAPNTVNSFVFLAREGFYNGVAFHRVINGFMVQTGDPTGTGRGGPGYRFADELTGQETYPRGTIAMGNQGPDTNGSQWIIVHSHANIAPAYTVLGRVTEGMEAIDAIVAGGIIPGPDGNPLDGAPAQPVKIRRIRAEGW